MCEYCSPDNSEENLSGDDGVYLDQNGEHYLFIEHFNNEKYYIKVNYCPKCGRNLS